MNLCVREDRKIRRARGGGWLQESCVFKTQQGRCPYEETETGMASKHHISLATLLNRWYLLNVPVMEACKLSLPRRGDGTRWELLSCVSSHCRYLWNPVCQDHISSGPHLHIHAFSVHLSHSGLFFLDSLLRKCQSATGTTKQSAPGQVRTSSTWAFPVSVTDLKAPEQHRAVQMEASDPEH